MKQSTVKLGLIGAGVSGTSLLSTFMQEVMIAGPSTTCSSFQVELFDKSRGLGGRCSTKRIKSPEDSRQDLDFDHGAQYFTVQSEAFSAFLQRQREINGPLAEWNARMFSINAKSGEAHLSSSSEIGGENPVCRYVGLPSNSSLAKSLFNEALNYSSASAVSLKLNSQVDNILAVSNEDHPVIRWKLVDQKGEEGLFDQIVLSAPPVQTASLLRKIAASLDSMHGNEITINDLRLRIRSLIDTVESASLRPCWCLMISFAEGMDIGHHLPFDAAFVNDSPVISWLARNSSKPGRALHGAENWVIHASPSWSEQHLEESAEQVQEQLLAAFRSLPLIKEAIAAAAAAAGSVDPLVILAHRWRFASAGRILPVPHIFDPLLGIGVCGDWCGGPKIEGAFLSGRSLGLSLFSHLSKCAEVNRSTL